MFAMDVATDVERSIAASTRTLYERRTVDETLQAIAEVTRDFLPGFDQVGVSTLHSTGRVVTRAFLGDMVLRLDEIQYGLWEGPCVDALNGSDAVPAPDLGDERRWARYVPQAVALGVRSQLALRLHHVGNTIGSINLYSTLSDDVGQEAQALARMWAIHAAVALRHAQQRASLVNPGGSRTVIEEAVGILMERYEMNADRAFAFLVRASSHTDTELRAVAQELVDERNRT